MKLVPPQIVVATGMHAAGKSTICRELAREIVNAVYLDRDTILWGMLYTAPGDLPGLKPFAEYVGEGFDVVADTERVETFGGPMVKLWKRNVFYERHMRHQSYLALANVAAQNLFLDKVVIVDSFLVRQVMDGTLRRFLEGFRTERYDTQVVHFVAENDACWDRHLTRSEMHTREELAFRTQLSGSREQFDRTLPYKDERVPKELAELRPLVVETTGRSVEECRDQVIAHLMGD